MTSSAWAIFEDDADNQKLLHPDFLDIDRRQIDESGFPSEFHTAISHEGRNMVLTFKKDDEYESDNDNTYILEDGVLKKEETKKVN